MPIEFWKAKTGWFWTARSSNGKVISDSAEIYSSRAKAVNGAKATATEFLAWQKESKSKNLKKTTSAPRKPVAKASTSSKGQTRTQRRGG